MLYICFQAFESVLVLLFWCAMYFIKENKVSVNPVMSVFY